MEENKKESVETSMTIYVFEIQKERKPIIRRPTNNGKPWKKKGLQDKENGTSDEEYSLQHDNRFKS